MISYKVYGMVRLMKITLNKWDNKQERNLRNRLILIISCILILPTLVICYVFSEQRVFLHLPNFILFLLGLVLVIAGIIIVYCVFKSISSILMLIKKAMEDGEKVSLNLHLETVELREISTGLNTLLERLEETTKSLSQAKEALFDNDVMYHNILFDILEAYYEVDLAGNFTFFNPPMSKILGYSEEELKGTNYRQYMDKESASDAFLAFNNVYRTGIPNEKWYGELIRKDGNKVFVGLSISLMRNSSGQPIGFRGIIHDITDRKKMEEEITALSIRDSLTGLYNRRGFINLAEQQLKIVERTKKGFCLFYMDLDGLKTINDRYGHIKGDEALRDAAMVLQETFRVSDIIARIGGDEFTVLALDTSPEFSHVFTERLHNHLAVINVTGKRAYNLSMSVGMVYSNQESPLLLDELMQRADSHMYEKKKDKS